MKIMVRVKTGAREARVEKIDETHFAVAVRARAENGRANAAVEAALAEYFRVPKSSIKILSGASSKSKLIQLVR